MHSTYFPAGTHSFLVPCFKSLHSSLAEKHHWGQIPGSHSSINHLLILSPSPR